VLCDERHHNCGLSVTVLCQSSTDWFCHHVEASAVGRFKQKLLMITLRCTRKLLDRTGGPTSAATALPTTVLGDWYANLIYARPQQLVLCMNERSLLVVILPAKDFKNVAPRFRAQVGSLLTRIGVPLAAVAAEERAMSEFAFGPTANRKVLGCLNEAAFALSYELQNPRFRSLAAIEVFFSEYIYRTTKYRRPGDLAKELFAASGAETGASVHRIH